jgi:hypothetical protein
MKLLLPFGLAALQIILKVITQLFPKDGVNMVLEMYSTAFGEMSVRLMPLILKITHSHMYYENKPQRRRCLNYSLLVLLFIATIVMKIIVKTAKGEMSEASASYNPIADYEFLKLSIEMICLIIISKILLKYKYFIHHVISITIFIVIGIICDIFIDKYEKLRKDGIYNFLDIFAIIIDSLYYCYIRYLMEKKFVHYWNIGLTLGLTLTTFATLLLFVVLIDKDKSDSDTAMIYSFYRSFQEGNIGLIILKQFTIILLNFFLSTFTFLTSFYFEPSFVLISYEFSKFYQVLKDHPEKAYVVVFFILQFFCLMIVLEIIELNFCALNKNTKRNISQRGMSELLEENGRDSTVSLNQIDINKDYYITNSEENKKNEEIELKQQSYNDIVFETSE